MEIYHGSQAATIDRLRTERNHPWLINRKVAYGTPNWLMALIMGVGWHDDDINLGTINGKPHLREVTAGAFQRFFTRQTYIYTLDDRGWHQPPALCGFEYLTEHAKEPEQQELIINPWETIKNSHVELIYY